MKRLTLLTILLVVVGLTAGFAMDVKPSITLTGTAKVEWGIDLDTTPVTTGFKNTADLDLTLNLIAADSTDTHQGTGDWYGYIQISNIEVYVAATEAAGGAFTVGTLGATAKVVGLGGALAIGVYGDPTLGTDLVGTIEHADFDDTVVDIETSYTFDYAGGGTYVSYNVTKDITVGLEVVSELPWTTNLANAYALGFDAKAVFAPLTVTVGADYGFNYSTNETVGFGVKVAADTAMLDPWVAFDGGYNTVASAFGWEVGAGATLTLPNTDTLVVTVLYGPAATGPNGLDAKVVFTEPAAKGFVDNLDLTVTAYLLDIAGTNPMEYEFIVAGGYLIGKVRPHFSVTYGDASNPVDNPAFLSLTVGVEATLIPLTKFELHYASTDLLSGVAGTIIAGVTVTY